MVVKSGSKTKR